MLPIPAGGFMQEQLCCEGSSKSQAGVYKMEKAAPDETGNLFSEGPIKTQAGSSAGHLRHVSRWRGGGQLPQELQMTHVYDAFLFRARFAPFTSCWLFSPTATLGMAALWVISRDVWRRLQLLNESASPLPTSPSFQVCRPVDSKICLLQSLLSPGCCRPGSRTFGPFPGLLCSHFCFFYTLWVPLSHLAVHRPPLPSMSRWISHYLH